MIFLRAARRRPFILNMSYLNATLTNAGVSLVDVVSHVLGGLNGYAVRSAADTAEYVAECYDGAVDLTILEASNAAARFATNDVVRDVAGLLA